MIVSVLIAFPAAVVLVVASTAKPPKTSLPSASP
jgi:hypothetical protein